MNMADKLMDDRGVNDHEENTELAAVWYAANYYYEASLENQREYGGAVFRRPTGRYSVTIRKGDFERLNFKNVTQDVPAGCETVALWHTHLPETARKNI